MDIGRITKRAVDALDSSSRDIFLWDEDLSGFGLRITPSGHKTYVVQYRIPGLGRRAFAKRLALGEHGMLTPEEASASLGRSWARWHPVPTPRPTVLRDVGPSA